MKKTLIAALALLAGALSAKSFEGSVTYQAYNPAGEKAQLMTMYLKDGKTRMEAEGHGHKGISILDPKAKTMTVLMPEKQRYMVMSLEGRMGKQGGKPKGKLVKTGKTETIAGYKAEEWQWQGEKHTMSLWGSTELGSMMAEWGRGPRGDEGVEIPAELKEKGFFPLRMGSENGQTRMEAVAVKPGSLDAGLFEVPAGYSEMKGMGAMGGEGGGDGAMPADAREKMRKAMKNMSPEQMKMMREMMKGRGQSED